MADPDRVPPILGVHTGEIPSSVLVVGDPARAEKASHLLDQARLLGQSREYHFYAGLRNGLEIGVVSHGVGGPGAAICFEELCRAGVTRLVRAGTAGGMQPHVRDGDLVVATAAVRDDGHSDRVVPIGYPAVADRHLTAALAQRAGETHEGVVLTTSLFYPHEVLGSDLEMWQRSGVVAVEMEAATLMVVASLHGVAAGVILAIDGNPLASGDTSMEDYDPDRPVVAEAVDRMMEIALDVLAGSS